MKPSTICDSCEKKTTDYSTRDVYCNYAQDTVSVDICKECEEKKS